METMMEVVVCPKRRNRSRLLEFADRRYVGLEELHAFGDCRR
jgi:hypothetical protein